MAQPSENIFATILNGVLFAIEILILIVKFLVVLVIESYNIITASERDVSGEIVLITGTGHGIGKGLAEKYSSLGATVVCWDINEKLNLETVDSIKSKGGKAFAYTVDVTNREKVLEAGKKVQNEVGIVTILVNNAGIMPQHEMLQHTEKEIRMIFEINVLAHFWLFESFLPQMIERNNGHVVALSSMAGAVGLCNLVPYCGSKFAVRGIQEALSAELRIKSEGKSKVKFTTIMPYMVDTGLCKKVKIRLDSLMPVLKAEDVVEKIVSAQRKGLEEISIPQYMYHLAKLAKMFPNRASDVIKVRGKVLLLLFRVETHIVGIGVEEGGLHGSVRGVRQVKHKISSASLKKNQ